MQRATQQQQQHLRNGVSNNLSKSKNNNSNNSNKSINKPGELLFKPHLTLKRTRVGSNLHEQPKTKQWAKRHMAHTQQQHTRVSERYKIQVLLPLLLPRACKACQQTRWNNCGKRINKITHVGNLQAVFARRQKTPLWETGTPPPLSHSPSFCLPLFRKGNSYLLRLPALYLHVCIALVSVSVGSISTHICQIAVLSYRTRPFHSLSIYDTIVNIYWFFSTSADNASGKTFLRLCDEGR